MWRLGKCVTFYDVFFLALDVLVKQDIFEVEQSVKDAFNQYKSGIVYKTDYNRAQIYLNNATAQRKQYQEDLTAKFSLLKLLMGHPAASIL